MRKPNNSLILLILGAMLVLAVCCRDGDISFRAPDDAGIDGGAADADGDADGGPVNDAGGGEEQIYNVEGTWAALATLRGNVNVVFLGAPVPFALTAEALTLIDIKPESDHYLGTARICDLDLATQPTAGLKMTITVPDAFVENLDPVGVPWYANGNTIFSGQFIFLFGMQSPATSPDLYTSPATDAMPADATDPRVFDQDVDSQPGVTINVDATVGGNNYAGDLYVVLRHLMTLEGTLDSENTGSGLAPWSEDLVKLGTSLPAFEAITPKVKANNGAKANTYAMVRVDSALTCADVKAQKDTLFN